MLIQETKRHKMQPRAGSDRPMRLERRLQGCTEKVGIDGDVACHGTKIPDGERSRIRPPQGLFGLGRMDVSVQLDDPKAVAH